MGHIDELTKSCKDVSDNGGYEKAVSILLSAGKALLVLFATSQTQLVELVT